MFFQPAPRAARPIPPLRDALRERRGAPWSSGAYRAARAMRQERGWLDRLAAPETPATAAGLPAPSTAVIALNRCAFGPRPGDVAAFESLGVDELSRLTAWVDQQLDPGSIADTACEARITGSGYTTQLKTAAQLWQDHHVADPAWEVRLQPALEAELLHWTRAVYSERQLLESMAHFWHNHFNIFGYEFLEGPTFGQFDRLVIRPHAFGNFRTLIEAVAQSPGMLVYLDNYSNFADGGVGYSNENYARELIELHGLGAAAAFGKVPRASIPLDGNNRPVGYCEEDVQDMARALTGWTFDTDWLSWLWGGGNTGQFSFVNALHSTETKTLLGTVMPSGRTAQQDGQQAFDLLASHPACGRFLAKKLLRRFLCDFPETTCPELYESTAALWTSLWQDAEQIQKVLRHILLAEEFRSIWGEKIKRPFEIVTSAMRAGQIDFRFYQDMADYWGSSDPDAADTHTLHWLSEQAGQEIFGWHPPNGHPDVRAAWQSASPRVAAWRTVDWLIVVEDGADLYRLDVFAQTPPEARSAEAVVDFWIPRIFGRTVSSTMRDELVDFMSQGFNSTFDLPLDSNEWPYYWGDRLQALVGLLFMSPEFLWR